MVGCLYQFKTHIFGKSKLNVSNIHFVFMDILFNVLRQVQGYCVLGQMITINLSDDFEHLFQLMRQ